MSKLIKFNEFINNDSSILELIEDAETTNLPDLEEIAQRESYRKIVNMGEKIIPYLLKRNSIIWERALKELTGDGPDPMESSVTERVEFWKNWAKENGY